MRVRAAAWGLCAAMVAVAAMLALAASAAANHSITEHVSIGPAGGNGPYGVSISHLTPDGSKVLFQTSDKLVATDTDTVADIYERGNGMTTLITPDPISGPADDALFLAASQDHTRILFRTREKLTSDDLDGTGLDIYEWLNGTVTLLSKGPLGSSDAFVTVFYGASPDATRVYWRTRATLVSEDTDGGLLDFYQRVGGVTTLASTSSTPGTISADVDNASVANDGSAIYFSTPERLAPEDTDSSGDVYEHSDAGTRQISVGTINGNGPSFASVPFGTVDPDHVYFFTTEALVTEDTDLCNPGQPQDPGCTDVYEREGNVTRLVSASETGSVGNFYVIGSFRASDDGTHAVFSTEEQLVDADLDSEPDLYERFAGETRLVSTGPVGGNGPFEVDNNNFFISPDGSRIFFQTAEKLTLDDVFDGCGIGCWDTYERSGGTTTLVTGGPEESPGTNGVAFVTFASPDGSRAIFGTFQDLSAQDDDGDLVDVYERLNGTLYLLTPEAELSPGTSPGPASADGSVVTVLSPDRLGSTDTDNAQDAYRIFVPPSAYARPKAATPINVPFVPAYEACASPNRVHAVPLSFGSCAPPAEVSDYLTLGTFEANGQPAKAVSNLRLLVLPGNPSTPANEADARYEVQVTDVRNKADLTDYTGALMLDAALQITDRNNPDGGGGSPNATGSQPSFPVIVPCMSTSDTTVGSTCSITTTAQTLAPGSAVEGQRAIWETGQVRVSDGGADGNPATADGEGLFLVQGVFIP